LTIRIAAICTIQLNFGNAEQRPFTASYAEAVYFEKQISIDSEGLPLPQVLEAYQHGEHSVAMDLVTTEPLQRVWVNRPPNACSRISGLANSFLRVSNHAALTAHPAAGRYIGLR
jgi:hypothetical protein